MEATPICKITLIRHAQSTYNAYRDNSRDVSITHFGKKQAKKLHGRYDLVICSTLRRTSETLDASNIKYQHILFSPIVREMVDGHPSDLYENETEWSETTEEYLQRIVLFKKMLEELGHKYKRIAVISHGTFLQDFYGCWFGNCHQHDLYL